MSGRSGRSRSARATVLFADVVGSTALGDTLDPEDVQEIVGSAVAQVARLVEVHGGSVREIAGDGVLAVFGIGTAASAGPDDAVDAGYAIACFATDYALRLEVERELTGFGIRVGVHTGDLLITPSMGGELLSGEAAAVATALEAAADPGALLVGMRTVAELVRGRAWAGVRTVGTTHGPVEGRLLVPGSRDHEGAADSAPVPSEVPPAPDQGMREERKVVTALFVRVHTAPAQGGTAAAAVSALEGAADIVERYGGSIKDRAGGGLVCLFGAPRAREDDAERAVRAGIEIVAPAAGGQADLAAGITTGLVVLGPIDGGGRPELSATGDTMNTAARLHAAAEPGTVLVARRTQRLVADRFEWGPPREFVLKGKSSAVVAFSAVRPVATGPSEQLHTTTMVGREDERAILARAASAGCGQILIEGEAGLGKTRLLAELRGSRSWSAWLETRCSSFGSEGPYGPLRQLVLSALGLGPATEASDVRGALTTERIPARTGAFLALAAAIPPSPEEQRVLGALDPATIRYRVAQALGGRLAELPAPVVVAVEDIHWAPEATMGILTELAGMADELAFLLVVTRRPDARETARALVNRITMSGLHLRLGPLTDEEQRRFLESTTGIGVLPVEVEDRIAEVAGGNPFFLQELLGSLRDRGRLVPAPGGWRFTGDPHVELPDTVERVLLARIDQLSPVPRAVLDAAAIVGRDFVPDVVADVAGIDSGLDAALGELVDADLIEPITGEHTYTFRHSLVQETAYRRILTRHRRSLHARAAESLAGSGAEAAIIARHWWEGGDAAATLEYARRAGRRALALADPERAANHLALAVEAADALGASDRIRLPLLADLGEVALSAGRLSEATGCLERAGRIALEVGDVETLARVAVAHEDATFSSRRPRSGRDDPSNVLLRAAMDAVPHDHPIYPLLAARLAQALTFSGEVRAGRELADIAVAEARAAGSRGALSQALLAWRMGRQEPRWVEERLEAIDETVIAADDAASPRIALEAARLRVIDLLELGDIAAADRAIADVTARIEDLREPQYLWYPAMWRAMRTLLAADLPASEEAVARFHEVGRRFRFGGTAGVHGLQLYLLRREQQRAHEVVELCTRLGAELGTGWLPISAILAVDVGELEEASRLVALLTGPRQEELSRDLAYGVRLALTAEAAVAVGDADAAEHLYRELLPYEGRAIVVGSGAVCLGASSHYLGILAGSIGEHREARRHLEAALRQNIAMGAVAAAGSSACGLAALPGVEQDRRRRLARRAHDDATRHGLVRLRERSAALLEDLDEEDARVGTR